MNHDSPSEIRAILESRGLSLKKRWGQNFLLNRGARQRIVGMLDIAAGDRVWEIGPGLGSMTELLLAREPVLTVFELDRGLCRYLEECFGARRGFALVAGDFMETWGPVRASVGAPQEILGNLPYRSASLMIAGIVEGELRPRRMVFTVQRELADRLTARPGAKDYSSFTVLCRACFLIEHRGDLKPGSFYPVPEVDSSIIEMRPREGAPAGECLAVLSQLTRGLFSSRRKTLRNNASSIMAGRGALGEGKLTAEAVLAALEHARIDPRQRAEEIPPEAYVEAARFLTGPSFP